MDRKVLDQQSQYWENNFLSKPGMFGLEPSEAAINTLKTLKEQNIKKIVELGAGLGRDTIFFAKNSISNSDPIKRTSILFFFRIPTIFFKDDFFSTLGKFKYFLKIGAKENLLTMSAQ